MDLLATNIHLQSQIVFILLTFQFSSQFRDGWNNIALDGMKALEFWVVFNPKHLGLDQILPNLHFAGI